MRFLLLALLLISSNALATCIERGCYNVYVERLYINASGTVYVGTSGDETLMSCAAVSNIYSTFKTTDAGADMIFSALLAAQMADKKVSVRTDDNSAGCTIRYVTIDKQ
ncbi:hypothetical protein FM037_24600 [Shewanella psychropiezotolerans]|uniref:Uncharacterized protein n=1 Tax=Shewanella psychropiezotolerans TaxID=2593655 RepID=A0ABX5X3C2_9GAMM|nr:hypothetical protein [Shewanella psychropiezotolerans]QDO85857.1 hypothetical protein FM037_24600 [Shewanella psychropiezotolerans]